MLLNSLYNLVEQAKLEIIQSQDLNALELIRIKFLGKKGYINFQIKNLNTIPLNIRPKLGIAINQVKNEICKLFIKQETILKTKKIEENIKQNILDITLPGRLSELGTFHPITQIIERIKIFFKNLGFITIYGPEIENSYFNFDALNISEYHPARDEHDTFWFNKIYLLRTHTSGIQIRAIKNKLKPPLRIMSFGRVYRKDYDKNHTPMFHQMEGIMIDASINFSHLKKILHNFLYNFFEKDIKIRFRPSYFPFTEPSAEIDISKPTSENWSEILGCGMIHPKILHNIGINPKKFAGCAFGMGIERLTMLRYQINDIRIFFENDLRFLKQFR